MAYLEVPQEEEERVGQPAGAAGAAVTGTSGAAGTPATPADRTSGQWTNLQDYLRLNRPQAQQMAGRIAGDIEQQRGQYGQQTQQAGQQYQDYLKGLEETEAGKKAWTERVAGGWTPTTEEIQEKAGAGYFGQAQAPTTFQPTAAQEQQRALQQRLARTQTEAGRTAELQRIQGQQATRGEGLLNQLLLQGSQAGREALGQQRQLGTGGVMDPVRQQALERMAQTQQTQAQTPEEMRRVFGEQTGVSEEDIRNYQAKIAQIEADRQLLETRGRGEYEAMADWTPGAYYNDSMFNLYQAYQRAGLTPPPSLVPPWLQPDQPSEPIAFAPILDMGGQQIGGTGGELASLYDKYMQLSGEEYIDPMGGFDPTTGQRAMVQGALGQQRTGLTDEEARLAALQQMLGYTQGV
jgi:hypothetical protein